MVKSEAEFFIGKIFTGGYVLNLLLLLALTGTLFFGTVRDLLNEWLHRPDASHSLLIPFIVFFLIWKKRNQISNAVALGSDTPILLAVVAGVLLYLLGKISLVLTFERLGFFIFLIGSISFLIGKEGAKQVIFPLTYLVFMIPLPVTVYDYLTLPMKKIATVISVTVMSLFSLPVYREGTLIQMPECTLGVVNACSGLNSLISVLALGSLWCYLSINGNLKRLTVILLLIPISIAANVFRITLTVLISNYYDARVAHGLLHDFTGTLFVLFVAFCLIAFTIRLIK